mgnify:CR=1 FL=1
MPSTVQQVHGAGNVLDLPPHLAGRNPIAGKNINEYPLVIVLFPLRFVLQKRRMVFPDFGKILRKIRVCSRVLQNIPLWRSFIPNGKKLFIVLSRHHQVNIIVPRDKSLMPHSTDQGAVGQRIPQAVLRADLVDHIQYFLFCCPDLLLELI